MVHEKASATPVRIVSDSPAGDKTDFGFDVYAETLAGLIANKDNATPLVMGIYGPWGSGKTTLMNAIKTRLDDDGYTAAESFRRCKTVWFQAWKCNRQDEILAALIEAIFKAMAAQGFFTLAKDKVNAITRRIDQSAIFASVSKLVTGVDISEFFSQLPQKENLGAYDTFLKFFDDIVGTFLDWRFKLSDPQKPDGKKGALVIFIDDLDRCPPGHIVKVLETIKLFLDRPGCIFVLGADNEILEAALSKTSGPSDARRFLDKIVPTSFSLPPISVGSLKPLIENQPGINPALSKYLSLVAPALGHNPRQFKRFINKMNLLHGLLLHSKTAIGFEKVLFWGIIEIRYPQLAADINADPDIMFTLQRQIRKLMAKPDGKPLWHISDRRLKTEKVPADLHHYIKQPYLAEVVSRCSMTAEDFERLRVLSHTVQANREVTVSIPEDSAATDPDQTKN